MMRFKYNGLVAKTFAGLEMQPGDEFTPEYHHEKLWSASNCVHHALQDGTMQLWHDGVEYLGIDASRCLLGTLPVEVTPTLPKNEVQMMIRKIKFTPTIGTETEYQFKVDENGATIVKLFGAYIKAVNAHDDDSVMLEIEDVDGILGYGPEFPVKTYADAYICAIKDGIFSPDGAPGDIPSGLYICIHYNSCGIVQPTLYLNMVLGVAS